MPPKTLRELRKSRKDHRFVGRDNERARFRDNLALPIEERRFVWSVFGQGGVGKTWLVQAHRRYAEAKGWRTAWTGREFATASIPEVLHKMATDLAGANDAAFKAFADRYARYESNRLAIEADPDYLEKFGGLAGGLLGRVGVAVARQGAVEDLVDAGDLRETMSQAGQDLGAFIARKLGGKKDDVQLMRDPVGVLTPLFLSGLCAIADSAPVALLFDEYENRSQQLDPWLRALLDSEHGEVPANSLVVIAGRHALDRNRWADFEDLVERVSLEQFSDDEARVFLAERGIEAPAVVELILELSGGLPLLLATLAAGQPSDTKDVGDATGTAVERFLAWVDDPEQRELALRAALPRVIDRDVVAELVSTPDSVDALFGWLIGMPFVGHHADGWVYHDVVRAQMLGYVRRRSLTEWRDIHNRLASFYAERRGDLEEATRDSQRQRWHAEHVYHYLCTSPDDRLEAVARFWLDGHSGGELIAAAAVQAGRACADTDLESWGLELDGLGHWDVKDERSHRTLGRLVELAPDSPLAWLHLGSFDYHGQRIARSISAFEQAIGLGFEHSLAYTWLGLAFVSQGNHEDGEQAYRKALTLDPEYALAHHNLGKLLFMRGDLEGAETVIRRGLELDPETVVAHNNLGLVLKATGDLDAAEAAYRRALDLDPDYALARANLGNLHEARGDTEAAEAETRRALRLDPNNATTHFNLGVLLNARGDIEGAAAATRRSIELDPDNADAHNNLGIMLGSQGELEAAEAAYRRALDIDPENSRIRNNLGVLLESQERYQQAEAMFRRALDLDPDYASAHFNLADALRAQDELDAAETAARRGLELDPENSAALRFLADRLNSRGAVEDAEAMFRQAVDSDPVNAVGHNSLGWFLYEHGRLDEAEPIIRRALELDPESGHFLDSLGCVLWKQGRHDEAEAAFRRALELLPDLAEIHHHFGQFLKELERRDEAVEHLRTAHELDPDSYPDPASAAAI